ncbi:PREDICTED: WRKY transcription factor 22-like [Populus euphratica]|uniref:WRKY transcription factor 22-like n=1 Tax=Populus euphratica TaxID=75702 RepID=A0AAJ6XL61_POPEU|nr:PREDICTED: WRKY transcription factor 22-like [Populus euphratica]
MMSEFVCMEDSWDLHAVVRSGSSTNYEDFANITNNSPSLFAPLSFYQDELLNFQENPTDFDGLDGLYKPLHPLLHQTFNSPQSNILSTSISTASISVPKEVKERQKVQKKKPVSSESATFANTVDATRAAKSKRRKNQHKKVVQHVKEDGLSSDMWAWRKYGQKPIKGSPYPRSYYRCSSLKGCLARKQMERSRTDPSTFIITYTAEHSHAHPTRRSSLAGSTRIKPSMPKEATKNIEPNMPTIKDELSPNFDGVLSPTTPSVTSIEDELVQNVCIKNKELLGQGQILDEIALPDILFSDELFPSLEDLEGLLLDEFADCRSSNIPTTSS